MAEPEEILSVIQQRLLSRPGRRRDFQGVSVLVTAGPTREAIDPVRYISNRSSGKMGYAIARAARERAADVSLISGPVDGSLLTSLQAGVRITRVESAAEMSTAVLEQAHRQHIIIMAAAVSDLTPKLVEQQKIKKAARLSGISLSATDDILRLLAQHSPESLRVGFAAETENLVENAQTKLREKGLAMIVANQVGNPEKPVFDSDENEVTIILPGQEPEVVSRTSKLTIAHAILDRVRALLEERKGWVQQES